MRTNRKKKKKTRSFSWVGKMLMLFFGIGIFILSISAKNIIEMREDFYLCAICCLLGFSALLSVIFIGEFWCRRKKISNVGELEILDDYFGKISFLHKENNKENQTEKDKKENKERIKRGLEKNMRFLYSTWFYVSLFTLFISVLSIFEQKKLYDLHQGNWDENTSCYTVTAEVEKENIDYKIEKNITTTKDSLPFTLILKYKNKDWWNWINFRCPIKDTIIVNFIEFDNNKSELSQIEKDFRTPDSVRIDSLKMKFKDYSTKDSVVYFINPKKAEADIDSFKKTLEKSDSLYLDSLNLKFVSLEKKHSNVLEKTKKYQTKDSVRFCFISSKKFKTDFDIFLDSLKIDTWRDFKIDSLGDRIKTLDKWWTVSSCEIANKITVYFVYPKRITLTSPNGINLKCVIKREKNTDNEGADNEEKGGDKIKKDTNKYVHIIERSFPEDTLKHQRFFDEDSLNNCETKFNSIKDTIIENAKKEATKKGKFEDDYEIKLKPTQNWFSTLETILSLLANVFLLLFFGFLNTKTDLFSKNEKKSGVFELYRIFVVGIFFIIALVLVLDTAFPWYSNYSPIFSQSFLFVINLIIALTSIIAVFGCWGSMNNSYTSFPWFFKLLMFLYAMTHFFELNIHYMEEDFNKWAVLFLYFIGVFAKGWIIYILLCWAPKKKRILWFFLTSVNNFRTEEDYDDFVEIFNIHELERENSELKKELTNNWNSHRTLLRLKKKNVELKQKFDVLPTDSKIANKINTCNLANKNDKK